MNPANISMRFELDKYKSNTRRKYKCQARPDISGIPQISDESKMPFPI